MYRFIGWVNRPEVFPIKANRNLNLYFWYWFTILVNKRNKNNDHLQAGASISVLGFEKLLPIVERGVIDPSKIFIDILPLSEAVKGYNLMRDRASETLKFALLP